MQKNGSFSAAYADGCSAVSADEQFEFYCRKQAAPIRRYLTGICRSESDADDLIQQAFLDWLRRGRQGENLGGWIAWKGYRLFLDRKKVRGRESEREARYTQTLAARRTRPYRSFEEAVAVKDAIDSLPRVEQASITGQLRGESSEETGARLGLDPRQVRRSRSRAVQRLRRHLRSPWVLLVAGLALGASLTASGVRARAGHLWERAVHHVREFVEQVQSQQRIGRVGASSTMSLTALPDRAMLVQVELDARLVLRQTEIDLRGTVQVSQMVGTVRIDGVVAEREQVALRTQLAALPYVQIALRSEQAGDGRTATHGDTRSVPAAAGTPWANRRAVWPALMDTTTNVRQRVAALHALAQRYSEDEVSQMSRESRRTFDRLLGLHHKGLRRKVKTLNTELSAWLGGMTTRCVVTRVPADWRGRTAGSVQHIVNLDQRLRTLQVATGIQHDGMTALRAALDRLWETVHCPTIADGTP